MTVALFDIVEIRMVTIKAVRLDGSPIEWDMTGASKSHLFRFWNKLKEEGAAPDTGTPLKSAEWWEGKRNTKSWSRLATGDASIAVAKSLGLW